MFKSLNRTMSNAAFISVAAVGCACVAPSANADLVAYWNFNPLGAAPYSAAAGSGTISTAAWTGIVFAFPGTTLNALFGDPEGEALRLASNASATIGNGSGVTFEISMAGLMDLNVSYATQRPFNVNGFTTQTWSWSIDGVNFTKLGTFNMAAHANNTWVLAEMDFSSVAALNDAASVTLMMVLDGATAVGPFGTPGSNAFDNFQFNANVIPAPGVLALLGLAGLIGVRRRR